MASHIPGGRGQGQGQGQGPARVDVKMTMMVAMTSESQMVSQMAGVQSIDDVLNLVSGALLAGYNIVKSRIEEKMIKEEAEKVEFPLIDWVHDCLLRAQEMQERNRDAQPQLYVAKPSDVPPSSTH